MPYFIDHMRYDYFGVLLPDIITQRLRYVSSLRLIFFEEQESQEPTTLAAIQLLLLPSTTST